MLVLKSDFPATDKKKLDTLLATLVKQVKFTNVDVLGKKQLAYPIKKQTEGIYVVATLTGNVQVGLIEKEVRLGTEVLRYLLTVLKEKK